MPESLRERMNGLVGELLSDVNVFRGPSGRRLPAIAFGFTLIEQVVSTFPGSGKSKFASELATLISSQGANTLYLMLSHDAMDERMARITEDGHGERWRKWEGHEQTCPRSLWPSNGYTTSTQCDCGRSPLTASNRPTLAALDYIFDDIPPSEPRVPQISEFDLWIIDEFDLRRTLGHWFITSQQLRTAAEHYPNDSVKTLCARFLALLENLEDGSPLSGEHLYIKLDQVLDAQNSSLQNLLSQLPEATELPVSQWHTQMSQDPVPNFPPKLVHLVKQETSANGSLNPLIHLSRRDGESGLSIWWHKHLPLMRIEVDGRDILVPQVGPPVLVLDASSEPSLIRKVFGWAKLETEDREWPPNAHVYQWADDIVTRGTLGMNRPNGQVSRLRWYERIATKLADLQSDAPIGIITHKAIQQELVEFLQSRGFTNVLALWYFGERGSNELRDCKGLVLLGCPIPNVDDFQEEAQAFFSDESPLDFTWEQIADYIEKSDGLHYPVTAYGYPGDERAQSYFRQKCQFELYQAIHRIRPYIRDEELYIYVYTNVPIPGVKVDNLMGGTAERDERALSFLNGRLTEHRRCTVPEIASMMVDESTNLEASRRWVQREAQRLATIIGCAFEPGRGGRPGQFVSG